MNKRYKYILFALFFMLLPFKIHASYEAYINGNDVRIRTGPGTNNSILATVNSNTSISVDDKTLYTGTGCSDKWYKVTYNSKTGYVCSTYVSFITESYNGINVINWTARINANNVTVRSTASVDSSSKDKLTLGTNVSIISTISGGTKNCSGGNWYKISYYSNSIGYVCTNYVTKKEDITNYEISDEYKNYLESEGFPDSYYPFLNYLHIKHPNWIFKGGKTNLTFTGSINAEEGKCYMQTTNDNYRTSSTPAEGSSWFKVNSGVISFYMDPRNWLTEERIFMFEKLDYSSELESTYPSLVKAIFGSGALGDDKYTIPMINAGKTNKISPVHIASRIRLEVGANGSDSTNGGEFTWEGTKYSGFYNFFNIGAYEVTINGVKYSAVTRGLAYAAKLVRSDGNLWNDIEVSITEGSSFLANGYVNKGQGTLYYQKFNVGPNAYYSKYTHQYMTNIQAPAVEGNSSYNSYKNSSVLDQVFIFEIPIYNTMPSYTSLPNSGNTNNYLSTLEVEDYSISPSFDEDILSYEAYVTKSTEEVNIKATTASALSSISGIGKFALTSDENVVTIIVKSESGEERKYTLTIYRVDDTTNVTTVLDKTAVKVNNDMLTRIKNSTTVDSLQTTLIKNGAKSATIKNANGTVVTGSSIIGTNYTITIVTTNETKTFKLSVNGDTSGDGKVTILDLLEVQKHIKGDAVLSSASLSAADTSGDAKVTILDLLEIVKHIKGDSPL